MKLNDSNNKLNRKVIFILVLGCLTSTVVLSVFFTLVMLATQPPATPKYTPTIIPSKQITESSLPLREMWRWLGSIITPRSAPNLVIVDNHIVAATYETTGVKIVVFDAQTGNIIWKGHSIDHFRSVHADNERVYVGTLNNVQAFDVDTGQLLWTGAKQPWGKHGLLNVYSKGDRLEAYSYNDYILYVLDASSGELVESTKYPGIIIKMDGNIYGEYGLDYIWAKRITNQQLFWEQNIYKEVQLWPIFIDDMIYFSAGADSGIDNRQVFALSTETGEVVWQSPEGFISNVALGKNILYVIQGDATIVGLDPETGRPLGEIKMAPPRTYQDDNGWRTAYTIAASDEFVAVHYYNSEELIVFEQLEDSLDD